MAVRYTQNTLTQMMELRTAASLAFEVIDNIKNNTASLDDAGYP